MHLSLRTWHSQCGKIREQSNVFRAVDEAEAPERWESLSVVWRGAISLRNLDSALEGAS